jgi:hypothetical protein
MRFRSPGRDDPSFVIVPIGVNHRDFQAVHQANRINPNIAVVKPVIDPFNGQAVENTLCVLEGNATLGDVAAVLGCVPCLVVQKGSLGLDDKSRDPASAATQASCQQ